jgi:hypothetical protein
MAFLATVPWWQRLFFALCSLIFTLLLGVALIVARDFRRDSTLQWFNGGEIQVVGYFAILGGIAALATFLFFILPLVLLWPPHSQVRHWYAVVCVAMLWPPTLYGIIYRHTVANSFREVRRLPAILGWPELLALCCSACYLLLIRWRHSQLRANPRPRAEE